LIYCITAYPMAVADGERIAGRREETSKPMLVYDRAPVLGRPTSSHSRVTQSSSRCESITANDRRVCDRDRCAADGQHSSLHETRHPHHSIVKSGRCSIIPRPYVLRTSMKTSMCHV